jgi:glycosyltransferase involved in cell wall biosynthesis
VPPSDADALAAAIASLADDRARARALGEAGGERQRRLFARDAMVERVLGLLEAH